MLVFYIKNNIFLGCYHISVVRAGTGAAASKMGRPWAGLILCSVVDLDPHGSGILPGSGFGIIVPDSDPAKYERADK